MPLAAGIRIGPYEVLSSLGAGGMGEVYRARDTKLGRDVALKILPETFAHDPERLARFRREAQVLASLNHQNIATVYGLEESASTTALVMELVEGQTLADRITGPMPAADAVAIARQIAEALEAAHEAGIVHRDLKPANIKVRDDGAVKVLDFGLAKAMVDDSASRPGDAMNSPTLTARATQLGVILGTAAYMAPEQAKGRPVDKRADIWAFGVVLYEMLSGRRAYEGEDVSETLAAVLTREPEFAAVPASAPAPVVSLMRRCLERDPKRRLRDIGEARVALEDSSAPAQVPARAVAAPARGLLPWQLAAGGLALILLVGAAAWWRAAASAAAAAPVRVTIAPPRDTTFDLALYSVVDVSGDGSKIALTASAGGVRRLYVRRIGEFEPRLLEGTEGAYTPFFSPDGAWIGFFADGKLKKVLSDGGPVIPLADVGDARGGLWTGDDTIIFTPAPAAPVYRIPAAGGTATPLSTIDEAKRERTHRWPTLLPDGKTVLVTVGSVEHPDDYDDASIQSIRLDTGERRLVVQSGRMARYAATGHLLFLRGKVLYAVPFDPARLAAGTSPSPVIDGVSGDVTTGSANYAVSENGTIVFIPGDPTGGFRRLAWVDLQGHPTAIDAPAAVYGDPHVSPDGRRLAVTIVSGSSARDIYVVDPARGTSTRLTLGGENRTPLWTSDSRELIYVAYDRKRNVSTITRRAAEGTGSAEGIAEVVGQAYAEDLSRDGKTLLLSANPSTVRGKFEVFRIALEKGAKPVPFASSDVGDAAQPAFSPDARWVAYQAYDAGRPDVFVQSFATGGSRVQVSTATGVEPRWAPDGRTLYYSRGTSLMAVPIQPGAVFSAGKARELFSGLTPPNTDSGQTYAVAPKGDRFLMLRPEREGAGPPEMRLILNWFSELLALKTGK